MLIFSRDENLLGEASQITAQQAGPRQRPMGINYSDCDNRQWTLNIMHWLSGLLDEAAPPDNTSPLVQAAEPADATRPQATRKFARAETAGN